MVQVLTLNKNAIFQIFSLAKENTCVLYSWQTASKCIALRNKKCNLTIKNKINYEILPMPTAVFVIPRYLVAGIFFDVFNACSPCICNLVFVISRGNVTSTKMNGNTLQKKNKNNFEASILLISLLSLFW